MNHSAPPQSAAEEHSCHDTQEQDEREVPESLSAIPQGNLEVRTAVNSGDRIGGGQSSSRLKQVWAKVGGVSLTFSILIHIALFMAAGVVIFSSSFETEGVDFVAGGSHAQGVQASQNMEHKVQSKRRQSLNARPSSKRLISTNEIASIVLPEPPPTISDVPELPSVMGGVTLSKEGFAMGGAGGGFGTGFGMGGSPGFMHLPPSMRSRCSTAERLQKLSQNGGNSETEAAVSRALAWLKTKQNQDGSWGQRHKGAMTGLALLCYLGRCETPESATYGDNILKGCMYLMELAQRNVDGYFAENPKVVSAAYEHGIATYALGEMYSLARMNSTSTRGIREAFERGVNAIVEAQNEKGGWGYYTRNKTQRVNPRFHYNDLSVTGWQHQALKVAKNTGLKIPNLAQALDKCVKYIESTQTNDGGFGLAVRTAHYQQWSLTGVGCLGLQTLAEDKSTAVDRGIKFPATSSPPSHWIGIRTATSTAGTTIPKPFSRRAAMTGGSTTRCFCHSFSIIRPQTEAGNPSAITWMLRQLRIVREASTRLRCVLCSWRSTTDTSSGLVMKMSHFLTETDPWMGLPLFGAIRGPARFCLMRCLKSATPARS